MSVTSMSPAGPEGLHIICEMDVGLFALIHQVVSHIPCALSENRIPIVYYRDRTCYWTPKGYRDRDTVWEYYFEPLVPSHPASSIPPHIRTAISLSYPSYLEAGYFADQRTFVSANFGVHPDLPGKALPLPNRLEDPGSSTRRRASEILRAYVRPRTYVLEKASRFWQENMRGRYAVGVHIRGTDTLIDHGFFPYRKGPLRLEKYAGEIERLLIRHPDAVIFVATDAQSSADYMEDAFGSRVITYDSIRHVDGEEMGAGPTGCPMPGYLAADRDVAARNGEEAVVEYLLLSRCNHLVHNGSSLARTVLLKLPELPHTNTLAGPLPASTWRRNAGTHLRRVLSRLRNSPLLMTELFDPRQFPAGWQEWQRNGNVAVAPGSGEAEVTLANTLFRGVTIDDSAVYRYSLEAFSRVPGALVRLQINWHDASGKFMSAAIETRQCGMRWMVYAMDMKPPPGTRTGIVIVGGHTPAPVLVRSVSLKYPVRGHENSVAWL
jgi:hypothetical protein